jgi:hypothetical protein
LKAAAYLSGPGTSGEIPSKQTGALTVDDAVEPRSVTMTAVKPPEAPQSFSIVPQEEEGATVTHSRIFVW